MQKTHSGHLPAHCFAEKDGCKGHGTFSAHLLCQKLLQPSRTATGATTKCDQAEPPPLVSPQIIFNQVESPRALPQNFVELEGTIIVAGCFEYFFAQFVDDVLDGVVAAERKVQHTSSVCSSGEHEKRQSLV